MTRSRARPPLARSLARAHSPRSLHLTTAQRPLGQLPALARRPTTLPSRLRAGARVERVRPHRAQDPGLIWTANLAVLVGCYAFGYATGRDGDEVSSFSGPLRWLDFGSGQERGMTAAQREAYAARQAAKERDAAAAAESEVE